MGNTLFRTLLLLAFVWLSAENGQATTKRDLLQKSMNPERLKQVLLKNQSWVRYPAYTDRAGWDALIGGAKQEIIETGVKYLNHEWKVVKATDYLEYERSGSRDIMQGPYGNNNTALARLLMAELAEGKGRFLDQIVNGVWEKCEMTSWVLSAHLPAFQTSRRSLADPDEQVFDLTSGDVGSLLSWTWYFLRDEMEKVHPLIPQRLRKELQRRVLDPYMERDDFWWMAIDAKPETMVNNWNPWCNFNALTCFLLLENDPDKLAAAVYRSMVSVDQFINYNHEDGACEEGPSYWGHAGGKMYDYLRMLSDGTGGKLSVFDKPVIRNIGEYIVHSYVGDGWVVNFADASARGGGDKGVIYRYGEAVGSEPMKQFAAYLNERDGKKGYTPAGIDLFRTLENLVSYPGILQTDPATSASPYSWYPETEFCYMQNESGLFFAAKGGYNCESHNHNDVGTFSLYLDSKPVLIDVGVGTYTRQTFSSERYDIWTMQSNYHNLPMINGSPQAFGREFRSKNVTFDEGKLRFSLDLGGAYPKEAAVTSWQRTYTLEQKGGLVILDQFRLKELKDANIVNFMSWPQPDISTPGTVLFKSGDRTVKLIYESSRFDPVVEKIEQTDPRLSRVWGEAVYRLSLKAIEKEKNGTYRFRVEVL